jgi:hypothetical protein
MITSTKTCVITNSKFFCFCKLWITIFSWSVYLTVSRDERSRIYFYLIKPFILKKFSTIIMTDFSITWSYIFTARCLCLNDFPFFVNDLNDICWYHLPSKIVSS